LKFAYYPGCSLEGSSREYDESLRAVCEALGIQLVEIPQWNCCGASSVHQVDFFLRIALPALNLLKAEEMGLPILAPCAACFLNVRRAKKALLENEKLRTKFSSLFSKNFQAKTQVFHPLWVFSKPEFIERSQELIKVKLSDLKLVCYYGCYLVRPPEITEIDDPENPHLMERIMEALGIQVIDWAWKVDCCGGSHSLLNPHLVKKLSKRLVQKAKESGAQGIVVACPLCQANLDLYQENQNMPIYYFTELMGFSFGIKEAKNWFKRHMVKPSLD
jgi:heterodisulfide reductase subunit B